MKYPITYCARKDSLLRGRHPLTAIRLEKEIGNEIRQLAARSTIGRKTNRNIRNLRSRLKRSKYDNE
uniref:HTH_Tnp_Tc3_1 domain-containing protein n=1 Tax=Heterorhabditis bacteriophora TaxID=37862 RepID=A0A1I7XH67_HETBA